MPALTVDDNVAAPLLPRRQAFDVDARARELVAATDGSRVRASRARGTAEGSGPDLQSLGVSEPLIERSRVDALLVNVADIAELARRINRKLYARLTPEEKARARELVPSLRHAK